MIQVGTPGFSSVPFKKGEKPAVSLPLFTKSADGTTLFHSFKKVDSNLERGPRVDSEEREDGTSYNTTCTLAPGLCVSVFIREEMLKGNVLFMASSRARTAPVRRSCSTSNYSRIPRSGTRM